MVSSLLMVAYTVKIEDAKGSLVKDLHFTMLLLHITICFIYSNFTMTITYTLFACFVGAISISISSFAAALVEQSKLHSEILKIESDDRKAYKMANKTLYDQ
jgi:predicted membrane protein